MAREKATITLDRQKASRARELAGTKSLSEAIDVALNEFIRREQLRRDIAAYRRHPPTEDEERLGHLPVKFDLADEDVDYEALYGLDG